MRLILIRHGETPSNVVGALDTAVPGAPLTPLGHRQAAAIPPVLTVERITAVHASPLVRTQLTAAPLATARGLEVVVTDGLEEIAAGHLEMKHRRRVGRGVRRHRRRLDRRRPRRPRCRAARTGTPSSSGTTPPSARSPVGHADDATVVAFSHGAAIRTFAARHGGPPEARLLNTGAVVLEGSPYRGWAVTRWSRDPLGGAHLADPAAHDVTGDPDPV